MKKILIIGLVIVLIFCLNFNVFAEDNTEINVQSLTKGLNININADLNKGIDSILGALEKAGITISSTAKETLLFIYPLAVKRQLICGWSTLICGSILIIISIILLIFFVQSYKKYVTLKTNHYYNKSLVLGWSMSLLFLAGMIIVFCNIPRIISPEWYAIQDLIIQIQDLK
jgi:hypothetical protein